ncbi:GMC family oxidoreductase [Micromonospora sp. NBC_00860]|uniref:GMC family oxidoreductase n=1 Tax=Micromonospora sp. NBC_00860 TaxID=2975980 RepID=UPI0038672406|nr:GMC family oxidoreductase N-terminal domain-containing protein [Micromonospora sp. NBC_00860]
MPGYDYIVVGGGSAGSVIAARLSVRLSVRVLLLEAGSRELPALSAVPAAWPALMNSPANWGDVSVPHAQTGATILQPRGRGLGGSSAINGMIFLRAHRSSYDAWSAAGADGWGYDDLLPYFQRTERTRDRNAAIRGQEGPMQVAPAASVHPLMEAAGEAAVEAGHPRAVDFSNGLEDGVGLFDLNIVDGVRQTAADAYLRPILHRPNLHVVTDALVHRLVFDGNRCVGVDYTVAGATKSAQCSGEVVLTAGTIGSAQLLMLSGIGPKEHLREVGVDVLVDAPEVGANYHDHPTTTVTYTSSREVPGSAGNHAEVGVRLRSDPALAVPDVQLILSEAPLSPLAPQVEYGRGYSFLVSLMNPRSRGTIRLSGPNPEAPLLLDPNCYADPRDLDAMIGGLRAARQIGAAPALAPWRGEEVVPGPINHDATLGQYIRESLVVYWHPVGSCRMGSDPTSVVDEELRVRGVTGLRIADASVMPSIPAANTHATVLAVAERAADLIRGLTRP